MMDADAPHLECCAIGCERAPTVAMAPQADRRLETHSCDEHVVELLPEGVAVVWRIGPVAEAAQA